MSYAPGAGDYARFYSPTGIGVDLNDNIYVLGNVNFMGTDLRVFNPSGGLLWSLSALDYLGVGDFLPSSTNGAEPEIFTTTKHYKLNLGSAGNEWSLYSYLYNPFLYGPQSRPNNSSAIVRKLGSPPTTVVFTSGQGSVDAVEMFRLSTVSGEQLIPAGRYDGVTLWTDNGDGIHQSTENTTGTPFGFQSFDVDSNGNIHLIGTTSVRELKFMGIDPTSKVPLYSVASGNVIDRDLPAPFRDPNEITLTRVKYDAQSDSLYVLGATNHSAPNDGYHEYTSVLARYDGWISGPHETVFTNSLPTPAADPNFTYVTKPYSQNLNFQYEAMDVVRSRIFVAEVWGPVHVFDGFTGNQLMEMSAGPEVDGLNGWEDAAMGLRAGYNEQYAEYEVLSENSGFRAKQNFFRWGGETDPKQCNALGNAAFTEIVDSQPGVTPTGTGGTIADGLYRSLGATAYDFSTVPAGSMLRDTLRVSGNTVQTAVIDWAAYGSQNFTIQTSGSSITGTETCSNAYDSGTWPFSSYTATPTQLTLFSASGRYSVTYIRIP